MAPTRVPLLKLILTKVFEGGGGDNKKRLRNGKGAKKKKESVKRSGVPLASLFSLSSFDVF
jgi:hypothetical protein